MKIKNWLFSLAAACGLFYFQNAQATCSNYTTYTDGQTLTAASLNSLQTNFSNCSNDILDGDTFTGNMLWYSGADIQMYSDTGSTLKFDIDGSTGNFDSKGTAIIRGNTNLYSGADLNIYSDTGSTLKFDVDGATGNFDSKGTAIIRGNESLYSGADLNIYSDTGSTLKALIDGATGATIAGLTQAGQLTNCGMSVSGSTFTIAGYDGTALSATNPCVIAIKSDTAGRVALAYFTANVTFTFGSTSDTDGNLFGISDVDWSNKMPFFVGVIYDGTTPYFTISRSPCTLVAGATTLCQKGDTDCDGASDTICESDVMLLTTGATLSNYVYKPITQIGWFFMTYATSGSAWTASVSDTVSSIPTIAGFNFDYEKLFFKFPTGEMGASSQTYLKANGGTAPVFNLNSYYYSVKRDGMVEVSFDLTADGGTDGSGAVNALLSLPYHYVPPNGITSSINSSVGVYTLPASNGFCNFNPNLNSSNATCTLSSGTNLLNSDFSNGSRQLRGTIRYPSIKTVLN